MLLMNKTLIRMARGLWGWMGAIVLCRLLTLVGTASFSRTVSGFLGDLTSPAMTLAEAGSAIASALIAAAVILAADLLTGEAEYRCTAKARQSLRTGIFSKALELDVGNIEKIGPVSAITSSVDGVESMQIYYSKYLPGLIYCVIAPFYLFFQLKDSSLPTALVLLAVSLILLPANNLFRKHIESLKTDYWQSMEDLTGYYLESVQGLTTLKLFHQDERRTEVLQDKADRFNNKIMDVMRVNFTSFLFTDGMIYGCVVLAAVTAFCQLAAGSISFSAALMALMLSYSFFGSFRQLMNATHSALAGVAAAEKVEQLLSIDTSRPWNPDLPAEKEPFRGIRLEHISYAYEGRAAALTDISFDIPKNSVTALAGLSGCGKSTVAGMLMRFYDPASGRILLEGKDYISMTPEELRRHIIMVPQTVSLFAGTVRDNLRMAAPDAADEQLLEALDQVMLGNWIRSCPEGLDTQVGDSGSRLSGGQRQKIGIARALLCQAEYIIFDEATSSVDIRSEQEIWHCIEQLAHTRTLIIISHRLSTIRNVDQILVLSGGQIVQQGSHEELMKQQGLYGRLVTEQEELEQLGNTPGAADFSPFASHAGKEDMLHA